MLSKLIAIWLLKQKEMCGQNLHSFFSKHYYNFQFRRILYQNFLVTFFERKNELLLLRRSHFFY